ncbi:MAG: hypothetical protein KJI69_02235 [Patescibacteria group bacterium]|nr:hypothetical protein [Patescibacteria group bacterium]
MRATASKQKYQYWTDKEVRFLRNLYPQMRLKELARLFPKRNKGTIVVKAQDLGIPSAKLWQVKENSILRKNFINTSKEELLSLLPKRSWLAIMAQGERLQLKRNRQKPRMKVNEAYFQKWSSRMAYILGFILADGCIIKGTYNGYSDSLKFGVQKSDIDILEKIKKELDSEHKISLHKNAAYLSITSQKIVDDLKSLSISYRKSLREKIPELPPKFTKDFIRGIVDGDGSVAIDKKGYPKLSVYGGKRTILFLQNHFLIKLDMYSKIARLTKSKDGKHYLFSINYRTNPAKEIIQYLYEDADLYLDRKFQIAQQCLSIKIKRQKKYTPQEDQILTESYLVLTKDAVFSALLNRSWSSIEQRARTLGLYKHNKNT